MGAKGSIIVLLLLCITLGLLRCEHSVAPSQSNTINLTFWNGFTGPDGRVMLQMIREFNFANPQTSITMQRMDWGTYYNKLMVSAMDGRGPDVFVVHASTLARMNRARFVDDVSDLYTGTNAIPETDFDTYVLEQLKFDGKTIGVPLDIHPQGLFCNSDFLIKAGLVDAKGLPKPPKNREEFIQAIKAMAKDTDQDGKTDIWGFAYTMWRNNFMTLMPQFGGKCFDDTGKCIIDSPENIAALEFLASLLQQYKIVPEPENNLGWVGFRQAKVAMVFDGIYMLGDLQRLDDLKYIGAPIPQIGPKPGTLADSHVLCIRKGLTPDRRAAAAQFIHYLSDNSLQWAGAGQVPARRSVRATNAFCAMPVQYQFSKQVPYVQYPPKSTVLFELQLELDVAVEKVVRGRTTAATALKIACENVQGFVDRDTRQQKSGSEP